MTTGQLGQRPPGTVRQVPSGNWRARVSKNGQRTELGTFKTEYEAWAQIQGWWSDQGVHYDAGFLDGFVAWGAEPYVEPPLLPHPGPSVAALPTIPANVNVMDVPPLRLKLAKWLYAADKHAPFHNQQYIRYLLRVAERRGIKHLILGGDLFDFDSSSRHPKLTMQAGLNQTIKIGGDLLVTLAGWFEMLYILPGNHDERVGKKLDEALEFEALIHAAVRGRVPAEQLIITDYNYLYVGEEETGWVVGHPPYYDSRASNGLERAALRERRHAIGSHSHAQSFGWTHDGRFMLIYPGHMTDPKLTPYVMRSAGLSKFASWKPGFVLVENNVPTLFGEGITDWQEWQ